MVDSCIGVEVPEFTVTRQIRGATYIIEVTNSGGKGAKLTVDGVAIEGNRVPYAAAGSTANVTATV